MAAKRCPNCNLMNPDMAATCDCGRSFVDGSMTAPRNDPRSDEDHARRAHANSQLAWGAVLLGIGIVVTVATYGSASQSGGTYIIAYGPMIVGVIKIFRGLAAMNG
jgi:hypothetical protein